MYKNYDVLQNLRNSCSRSIVLKAMKLILFLTVMGTVHVNAFTYAQRITLYLKNIPLEEVLQTVGKQSGYHVLYNPLMLERTTPVTMEFKNAPLKEVLDKCFGNQPVTYVIDKKTIVVKTRPKRSRFPEKVGENETKQQLQIHGTVSDSRGAIAGTSVHLKGTNHGTTTDDQGYFMLQVRSSDAVLVFSMMGYQTQEIPVNGRTEIHVVMAAASSALDEVVVIGFGTQKKINLTGAVGVVDAKALESRPITSAPQALQGLVPGLRISTTTGQLERNMSISVRGTGTIGSGSSGAPLILIDGMEGDIHNVNPQDIETISVLKDAAASSIYGSRAPFGVILVTTKSGKEGSVSINYNNNLRNTSPIYLPKAMDSYSFANMMNEASRNQGVNPDYTDEVLQKMLDYQAGILQHGLDPTADGTAWEDRWTRGYANTDIWSETYGSRVFSHEHNLSASGGSSRMNYYVSTNYLNQGGLLRFGNERLDRFNLTGKVGGSLTNWLKFGLNTRFTRRNDERPAAFVDGYYDGLGRMNWPNLPLYDRNGNINHDGPRQLAQGGQRTMQNDQQYYQGTFIIEPVKNWITNVQVNYSIEGIDLKSATLTHYNYDPSGNSRNNGSQNTSLAESNQTDNYLNLNIFSEYSHTFSDVHNFRIMGGFQAEEWKRHYFSVTQYGLLSEDLIEFDLTSGLSGRGLPLTALVSGNTNDWATAGFFGRLNYDYQGRYLFEANLRYDGSSRFRSDSRWQLSPSFSAGWNVAQESFFSSLRGIVNLLKLRFSYGELGNQNTTAYYPTYRSMTLGSATGTWIQNGQRPNTAQIGSLISTSLSWEAISSWNAAVDYELFDSRLTGSFDYFTRYTKNMVGPAPQLPVTLGVNPPVTNNSDLQTRGWELQLGWRDRLKSGLGYGINFNFSDQTTYIDRYPGNRTGSIDNYMSGKKLGLIWGFESVGIARTQEEMDAHLATMPNGGQTAIGSQWSAGDIMYRDLNGDGRVTEGARTWDDHGDLSILGDAQPHYFYGVDLTMDWKGFDARLFLQGLLKYDFWPGESSYFWGVRGGYSKWFTIGLEQHNDYFRAQPIGLEGHEIPANLDSYFPRPIFSPGTGNTFGFKNQRVQTRYMQNAAYLRLKNLQLGYTLSSNWIGKANISRCRVFVSGENLMTFTSLFSVFDPETAFGGWGGNAYPLSHVWSAGLSLTF